MSEVQEETKQFGRGRRAQNKARGSQEDNAADGGNARPKTAGRGRGRGGKQNANNQNNETTQQERRPKTARQAANAAEGVDGDGDDGAMEESKQGRGGKGRGRGDRGNDRGNAADKQQDKNSWIYKYHNMERPQWEKIVFTVDTEIPDLPAKKDLLKEPTKTDFDRDMQAQDAQISEKRRQKDNLFNQRRYIREGGRAAAGGNTRKGELAEKINLAKGVRATKRKHQDNMREIVAQLQNLEVEKRELQKGMQRDCTTEQEVRDAIKDAERRLTTTSMSSQAEERLIKDIDLLKASIPKTKRYQVLEDEIKVLIAQKKEIWTEIQSIKKEEDGLNKQVDVVRKELELTNAEKDETKAQADKITEQINAVEEELTALYALKDQKREEYWKKRYDFKMQQNKIEHINWMQRQKDKVVQNEAYKQEREEERKQAIKNLPHPYQKELDCCEHLIGYLNTLKMRAGLIIDNEEAARQAQSQLQREAIQQKVDQKITEGKVQVSQSKQEREAAASVSIGGPRKQKGKKQKKAVEYEETFQLDLVIIKKFAMLGIPAPVTNDDLDDRIGKIEEKQSWFRENGSAKLQEQIEEMEKEAQEEEQVLDQEVQAAQTQDDDQPAGRGRGRGGRGGYRGGRGGGRGRGRGGFGAYQQARNEFEAEDDDDYQYSAPTKPIRNKQKKEDLKMDEDNYPAL